MNVGPPDKSRLSWSFAIREVTLRVGEEWVATSIRMWNPMM